MDASRTFGGVDDAKITPERWRIVAISGIGFFTDTYDLFSIGVVLKLVKTQWHIGSLETAVTGAVALVSAAIGSAVFGRIADVFGRKYIMAVGPHASERGSLFISLLVFVFAALPGYLLSMYGMGLQGRKTIQLLGFAMMRTTSHGIAATVGTAGAAVGTFSSPLLQSAYGLPGPMWVAGASALIGFGVTLWMLPQPMGLDLEAASRDTAFGSQDPGRRSGLAAPAPA